ncbi:MAG TPA: hypothetical protein DCM31_03105 [Deferribacteraceae bacterium]|nr:hypothetical protein [Deferribacteraceae bacterium]
MKKIFPLLIAIALFTGCSSKVANPGKVASSIDDTLTEAVELTARLNSGVLFVLISLEANSNISSLVFDKTKEKVVTFYAKTHETLPIGKTYYILPARITREGKTYYDEETGRMMRNYFQLSRLGKVTDKIQQADYIIVSRMKESIERSYERNSSTVVLSIMTKSDIPVFSSVIALESKADPNFWYYPTKNAIPSSTLSMKAMGQIFAVALPKAYGIPVTRMEKFEKRMEERAKAKKEAKATDIEQQEIRELEEKRDAIKKEEQWQREFDEYLKSLDNETTSSEEE